MTVGSLQVLSNAHIPPLRRRSVASMIRPTAPRRSSLVLSGAVAIVLAFSALIGPALAARPGSGATATIQASCNPCAVGTVVDFRGAGYDAKQGKAMLNIGGGTASTAVYADGTIAFQWPWFTSPGAYSVKVYQWSRSGKPVLKAETTVQVD